MSIENSFNKTFNGGKSLDQNITRHFERNAFERGGASKLSSSSNSSIPKRTQEQRVNELLASKKHHPKVKEWLEQKSNEIKSKKPTSSNQSSFQNSKNLFSSSSNVFNQQKAQGRSM
jgi:hypothetical protein